MNLKIIFCLNEKEGGCQFGKHFIDSFKENDKLHPFTKSVPIEQISSNGDSQVKLYNGEELLLDMIDSQIRPDLLQERILEIAGFRDAQD